ncbi:MAG: hypothetical protein COA78_21155 [Blastopirellula sp.]|nr:MAG: hypothetical protein COA78_21155 [Blastopirellula sp.]
MRTYNNSIVVQFDTTESGNSGAGKLVTVFDTGTTIKADLFDLNLAPISNPVQADDSGNYTFTVDDGIYDLYIDFGLPTQTAILEEQISNTVNNPPLSPGDNVLAFDILQDAIDDSNPLKIFNGAALNLKERTTGNGGGAMWDVVLASTVTPNTFNIVQCVGIPTLALVLRIKNNIYDAIEFGAIIGVDSAPVFQAISNVIVPFSTVVAKGIEFLLNDEVAHTVDNVHFDFGTSKMLNTVTLPIRIENSQGINPVFFIKASNCSATGGLWLDWVTQALYFGGIFNAGDPYDNSFSGVNAYKMRCERLISPTTQSKFIQTRHIDEVSVSDIYCLDMGKPILSSNAQPVSINYCTNGTIDKCTVENCLEGSAYNMLYTKYGHMTNNTATGISNTLDPAINVAAHIKFSINVEVSGNNFATINGECIKISDGTDDVVVSGNTLVTTGTDAGIFTVLQLQGTIKFNVSGNIIRTDGPRAIFAAPHVNSSPQEGLITGNTITRDVSALQPTSKGSGIWVTCSTSDRAGITVSGNFLFECDIYVNQMIDSHVNNNNISITAPLFYNGFDQLGGAITQIAAPITIESCNTTTCKGNSISNKVDSPVGFQVGIRSINSVFCNFVTNYVMYAAGSTLSYGFADIGSNSSIFRDNYSVNDVGYVQDINNATPAKHFYKRTTAFSMNIGTVNAGASAVDTAAVEMIQISAGNTFLSTTLGLPTQANGLLWSGCFTAAGTITFTFYNPTASNIVVNNRTYYITTERTPA